MGSKHRGYAAPNVSTNYVDCLRKLYSQIKEGDSITNPLLVPFVLTCAAALESKLNDIIVFWAWHTLGRKDYRKIAEALLSMNLKGRLDITVVLISGNRFTFREESNHYNNLIALISKRNKLLHNKGFYQPVEVEFDKASGQVVGFDTEFFQRLMKSSFLAVTASECEGFYRAIEALDDRLFYPMESNGLAENDMIRGVAG